MLTVETLSPAELEMIKVKREQEALAKKEADAKKAIQLEKDIKEREAQIAAIQKKDQEQVEAAKAYQAELGGMYTVRIETWEETKQVMGDYINRENGFDRHILWSKTYERQSAKIERNSNYYIKVTEQIVYSSRWSTKGTSKGYKMEVFGPGLGDNNRMYSRASKVNEVIKEAMDLIDARKKAEAAKKNAVAVAMQRVNEEYPDATVTSECKWERGYKPGTGFEYDVITVTFKNSIKVTYRVYSSGEIARESISFPESDAWKLMATLNQMNF